MKKIAAILFFLATPFLVKAQYIPNSGQAFQFASLYNPAFTGVEEFTDIKLGYRYQSTGFGVNAPKFINLSLNFRLKQPLDMATNALRTSHASLLNDRSIVPNRKRIIHGMGVNIFNEKVGLINRVGGGVTYSFHYPLSKKLRLASGFSALLESTKLDMGGIYYGQYAETEEFIEDLKKSGGNQSEINLRAGLLLYAKNFYVGISYFSITSKLLTTSNLSYSKPVFYRGSAQVGITIPLNAELVIKPTVLAILQFNNNLVIDYTVKGFIKERTWVALTYRDIKATVVSLGFDFNPTISAGYSYEMAMGDFKQFSGSSHELVLSLRFNNYKNQRAYTW